MHHDADSFYRTWPDRMNGMKARPGGADIAKAFGPYFQWLTKDSTTEGGLSVKQKELIALAIGVASRCEAWIYPHVEECVEEGRAKIRRWPAQSRQTVNVWVVAWVRIAAGPFRVEGTCPLH